MFEKTTHKVKCVVETTEHTNRFITTGEQLEPNRLLSLIAAQNERISLSRSYNSIADLYLIRSAALEQVTVVSITSRLRKRNESLF